MKCMRWEDRMKTELELQGLAINGGSKRLQKINEGDSRSRPAKSIAWQATRTRHSDYRDP